MPFILQSAYGQDQNLSAKIDALQNRTDHILTEIERVQKIIDGFGLKCDECTEKQSSSNQWATISFAFSIGSTALSITVVIKLFRKKDDGKEKPASNKFPTEPTPPSSPVSNQNDLEKIEKLQQDLENAKKNFENENKRYEDEKKKFEDAKGKLVKDKVFDTGNKALTALENYLNIAHELQIAYNAISTTIPSYGIKLDSEISQGISRRQEIEMGMLKIRYPPPGPLKSGKEDSNQQKPDDQNKEK